MHQAAACPLPAAPEERKGANCSAVTDSCAIRSATIYPPLLKNLRCAGVSSFDQLPHGEVDLPPCRFGSATTVSWIAGRNAWGQYLPIEQPCPQQRRIENFGPVGSREQDHAHPRVKAVKLRE